jgi:hypothetical protein
VSEICTLRSKALIEELIGFGLAEAMSRDPAPHLIGLCFRALQPVEAEVVFCIGETDELDEAFEYFSSGLAYDHRLPASLVEAARELARRVLNEIEKHLGCEDLEGGVAMIVIRHFGVPLRGEILVHDGRRNYIERFG